MWEIKTEAPSEIRGEFRPIATSVPGIRVCEHLPMLSRFAHKYQTVRSLSHRDTNHPSGCYWMMTGHEYPRASGLSENLSREDAYTLCSLAADLRVTQTVNGSKGIHCMIEKAVVHG